MKQQLLSMIDRHLISNVNPIIYWSSNYYRLSIGISIQQRNRRNAASIHPNLTLSKQEILPSLSYSYLIISWSKPKVKLSIINNSERRFRGITEPLYSSFLAALRSHCILAISNSPTIQSLKSAKIPLCNYLSLLGRN